MLDFLKVLKSNKVDTIFFLPGDSKNSIDIQTSEYAEPGEIIESSSLGEKWHIILFHCDEKGELINPDKFEAILSDPLEYISGLIPQDWFGILAKKTTTSSCFVEEMFAKLNEGVV
jgi:hypothetical protein